MTTKFFFLPTLAGLVACAPPIELDEEVEREDTPISEQGGPQISSELLDDGSLSSQVDASSEEDWVYLDLDTGKQVEVANPAADSSWDLGFKRFHIKMNSGVSGPGTAEGVFVAAELATVDTAPTSGYSVDQPDGPDDNEDPEYVFTDWYAYNIMTHVLTPEPGVYVVRSTDAGGAFAVEVLDYYDDAGSSGFISFEWKSL